jgi:chromosome segregation protein
MAEAVRRLRILADSAVPPDHLAGPARERIAALGGVLASLRSIADRWEAAKNARIRLESLRASLGAAKVEREAAAAARDTAVSARDAVPASSLSGDARSLIELVALGRRLGLRQGACPLCATAQSQDEFDRGMVVAETVARGLNDRAARAAELESVGSAAELKLADATRTVEALEFAVREADDVVRSYDSARDAQGIAADTSIEEISSRITDLQQSIDIGQRDLRVLDTLRFSGDLERAQRAEADAKARLARTQERLGRARKADGAARVLHNAARRAASETLDRRLERVLPLLAELYRRLRPHPVWTDIEYAIRGDVKRFLTLQVGDDLNPQFLFSSGQRRATGLAFLLSVNLSLAWSRWHSILLDDPVQHVDDVRTVHLAEVAAQLVSEGRQVICAVEDSALADLLCRRLPIDRPEVARRVTLGTDSEGALTKMLDRWLVPRMQKTLLTTRGQIANG